MSKELQDALLAYAETSHRAIDAAHAVSLAADLIYFLMGEDDSTNTTFRAALDVLNAVQILVMKLGYQAEMTTQSIAQRARSNPPRSPDPNDL